MFYRCLNSPFDYCNGKPTFEGGAPDEMNADGKPFVVQSRKCTRDYRTCPQRQSFSEVCLPKEKPVKAKGKKEAD